MQFTHFCVGLNTTPSTIAANLSSSINTVVAFRDEGLNLAQGTPRTK